MGPRGRSNSCCFLNCLDYSGRIVLSDDILTSIFWRILHTFYSGRQITFAPIRVPSESYIRTVHPHIAALHCMVVVCRLQKQDDEDNSVSGIRTKKDVRLIRNSRLC